MWPRCKSPGASKSFMATPASRTRPLRLCDKASFNAKTQRRQVHKELCRSSVPQLRRSGMSVVPSPRHRKSSVGAAPLVDRLEPKELLTARRHHTVSIPRLSILSCLRDFALNPLIRGENTGAQAAKPSSRRSRHLATHFRAWLTPKDS